MLGSLLPWKLGSPSTRRPASCSGPSRKPSLHGPDPRRNSLSTPRNKLRSKRSTASVHPNESHQPCHGSPRSPAFSIGGPWRSSKVAKKLIGLPKNVIHVAHCGPTDVTPHSNKHSAGVIEGVAADPHLQSTLPHGQQVGGNQNLAQLVSSDAMTEVPSCLIPSLNSDPSTPVATLTAPACSTWGANRPISSDMSSVSFALPTKDNSRVALGKADEHVASLVGRSLDPPLGILAAETYVPPELSTATDVSVQASTRPIGNSQKHPEARVKRKSVPLYKCSPTGEIIFTDEDQTTRCPPSPNLQQDAMPTVPTDSKGRPLHCLGGEIMTQTIKDKWDLKMAEVAKALKNGEEHVYDRN